MYISIVQLQEAPDDIVLTPNAGDGEASNDDDVTSRTEQTEDKRIKTPTIDECDVWPSFFC